MIKFLSICFLALMTVNAHAAKRWAYGTSKDEMSGVVSYFVGSPRARPIKPMGFPYADVESWIGVGCKNGRKWAYFGFTTAPNLSDTRTEDGYNVVSSRLKIDERLTKVELHQTWGAKGLHVKDSWSDNKSFLKLDEFIEAIPKSNKILLEVEWHGVGKAHFPYSMAGSARAMAKLESECN